MNRIFLFLSFCILFFSSIYSFEYDNDYVFTSFEIENIGDYEEEIDDERELIWYEEEEDEDEDVNYDDDDYVYSGCKFDLRDYEEDIDDEEVDEEEDKNFPAFSKSLFKSTPAKNNDTKNAESNSAMATLEAGPSAVVAGCVNAITGAFFESYAPLSLPGVMPLSVQCTYCSSEKEWHLQHMPHLDVSRSERGNHIRANYRDDNGSGMTFSDNLDDANPHDLKHSELTVSSSLFAKGLTNCGSGEISAKTNWRNSRFKVGDRKRHEKKSYVYHHSSNIKRVFSRYKSFGGQKTDAPTGKFRLTSEQHPHGNYLFYRYDLNGDLIHVRAANKTNASLGSLNVSYDAIPKRMSWGFGENNVDITFEDNEKKRINRIIPSHAAYAIYSYQANSKRLNKKSLPEGRFLKINYYAEGKAKKRVSKLTTPIGITHTFYYDIYGGKSYALDANKNVTTYHYDRKSKQLKTIDRYDDKHNLLTQDCFYWSKEKGTQGNLRARTFGDGNTLYFSRTLDYDAFGNVTQDHLCGNLTGKSPQSFKVKEGVPQTPTEKYLKSYKYTADHRNLLYQEDDGKKTIVYGYYPNQLLEQRLTKSDEKILKREFFEYDQNAVLVKETWDDGKTTNIDDLSDVTERHVKLITPRTQFPIGLPEIIEEQYLDTASGQYILLKRIINVHNDQGKLLQEDHYDSNNDFAYSLKWEYDRFGNVTKKIDALGQETTYRYDANSNKIYEEGPFPGWHKEFIYDLGNRLIIEKETWADGTTLTTSHEYNTLNQRIKTTNPQGNPTTFTYDALGRMVKTEGPSLFIGKSATATPYEETHYDAMGNAIFQQDANGFITKSAYTIRGKPYRIEHPDGSIEHKEYSLSGLLVKEIARNGLITEYTYDPLDRVVLTTISDPQGNVLKTKSSSYSTFHLLSETDEEGIVTTYEYDGAGRRSAMKKGDHLTHYHYDALGRLEKTIEGCFWSAVTCHRFPNHRLVDDARVTYKSYDLLDRVIEERIEDTSGQVFKKEQYTYDTNGKRTSLIVFTEAGRATTETTYTPDGKPLLITDALGNQTRFIYDHHFFYKGQIVEAVTTIDPSGCRETKVHDTHGNVCCQIKVDAFGRTIQQEQYYYDSLGQKTHAHTFVYDGFEEKHILETLWNYDGMGNLRRCVEANGTPEQKIVVHDYNQYGQKESTTMPNGISITHAYDALGRLSSYKSSDNTIHYEYSYDKQDRPLLVRDLVHHTTTTRSYDLYGHLTSETLDNGLTLTYTYDQIDRPKSVTLPDQSSINYHYNAHRLIAIERIKQGEVAYTHHYPHYDLAGNVVEETLLGQAGSIHYQYDLLQRPVGIQAPHWQESIPNDGFDNLGNLLKRDVKDKQGLINYNYSYDSLNQLTSEDGFVFHSYSNDSIYNRTAKDSQPYEINVLNQLKSQSSCKYSYDQNGNLKEKTTDNGIIRYVYDALDRLTEVRNGSEVTYYTYDSFHRRLSKTHNNITTQYIYQNENELGEAVNGKITQLRVLGLAYGAEIGGAVALELDDKTYAPIHDPQGNIVALVDPSGQLIENYRYTAFGETQVFSDSTLNNPWRFSSKRFDAETGFIYFGRRYYDPEIGRWITPDPAGFADGPNLYAYVHNHPLAYIDPDGQLAWPIVIALSLAIDFFVPPAIAFVEPYTGAMVGSFLAGVAKGYNNDYGFGDIADPSCQLCAGTGMLVGTLAGCKQAVGKSFGKMFFNTVKNEAAGAVTSLAAKNTKQIFHWSKQANPLVNPLTMTAKNTTQAAEKCLEKNCLKNSGGFAESFMGRKGWELKHPDYQPFRRNDAAFINNRKYSGHALDQMQNRGFTPSCIENTIKNGISRPGKQIGTTHHYDSINNISVILENNTHDVVTTSFGLIRQ